MTIKNKIPTPPSSGFLIGNINVHFYGLCIGIGFLAAYFISSYLYKKYYSSDSSVITNLAIVLIPISAIGARLYYVITMFSSYAQDPISMLYIQNGGLGIYGAIIAGAITVFVFCKVCKIDLTQVLRCIVPTVPLAQSFGRLGNWFNAELYGMPTDLPWGLDISRGEYQPSVFYHPTFLYEIIWDLIIFAVLMVVSIKCQNCDKYILPLYLLLYSFGRFWVETLRIDDTEYFLGFRVNFIIIVLTFCFASLWYFLVLKSLSQSQKASQILDKH